MRFKFRSKNLPVKIAISSAVVWILCIAVFGISLTVATGGFRGQVQSTSFGNSNLYLGILVGSFGMGILSFTVAAISVITGLFLSFKLITFQRNILGVIFFIPKILLVLAIFPFVLVYKFIQPKQLLQSIKNKRIRKTFDLGSFIGKTVFSLILIGVWIGGYGILWQVTRNVLGYVPENTTIVGTGSMYPTWPKGDLGKTSEELRDQVVGTAGFLRYPNGLVVAGRRLFGHQIERGDIVTAENSEIRKFTEETSGTPSGVLKRVIAIGGDTIEIKDGIVHLNDQQLKEPYTAKPHSTFAEGFLHECQKYTVPDDSVFLMGDNRKGSGDSREFGPVKYSEIESVLPLNEQKGTLDKNWHDTTNDLMETSKPVIDVNRFVELLNQKRKENGAVTIKHEPKLDISAEIRGENMLKNNSLQQEVTYDTIVNAMSKVGYWNSYVWEWRIEGYYAADELIEDYLERDSTDAKNVWFDKKFDDIGVAEVQGTLNGCPTQIIVIHAAGYIPATYEPKVLESWRNSLNNLNKIIPSWEKAKGWSSMNQQDLAHLLDLLYRERTIATNILAKEEARQWLSKADNDSIEEYNRLANESQALANKLNGK